MWLLIKIISVTKRPYQSFFIDILNHKENMIMKPKHLIPVIAAIMLASCAKNEPTATESITFEVSTDIPTETNDTSSESKLRIQNYVLGIKSSTDNLEYHGEPLNFDFSIENIGTDLEVGFMIVSGGVPVESEINGERSLLHIISVKEKETFDFSAAFDVYGNGDTYFHPLCILEPNTRINNVNKHFGNSFRIVTTAPIKVTSDSTSSTKTKLARSSKFITADESNLKKYRLEDTDTRMIILEQTEPKHITAVISGTQIETESSLFFSVNGVPTTVNGGNNAILVSEKKGGLAVVDAVFDTEPNDGDVVTAILAPTNDNYEIPSTYLFGADPISYNNSVVATAETTAATSTAIEEITAPSVSEAEQTTSSTSSQTAAVQPQEVSANTSGEYYNGDCIGETNSGNLIAAGYTELALLSPIGEILKTENASGLSQFELMMNSGRTFSGIAAGKPYNAVIYPGEPESYNVYLYDEDLRLADTIVVDKCSYAAVGTERIATVSFGENAIMKIYDISGDTPTKEFTFPQDISMIGAAAFSEDDRYIAFVGNIAESGESGDAIGVVDTVSGDVNFIRTSNMEGKVIPTKAGFLIRPKFDSGKAVLLHNDHTTTELDFLSGKEATFCNISANGEYTVAVKDSNVTLYETATGTLLSEWKTGSQFVVSVFVTNEGKVYFRDTNGVRPIQ